MANIAPIFDKIFMGSGTTVTKDDWWDLSSYAPDANSPIPSGKRLWLGFATFISEDKNIIFEVRPNLATKNLGNTTDTQLRSFVSVPTGESRDVDFFLSGSIVTFAPVSADSTGVEKLWLRTKSASVNAGSFSFMVFYTLY